MANDIVTATYTDLNDHISYAKTDRRHRLFERISPALFAVSLSVYEFIQTLILSALIAGPIVGFRLALSGNYALISLIVGIFGFIFFKSNHLYKIELITRPRHAIIKSIKLWSVLFLGAAMLSVMTKTSDEYSRLWYMSWYASGILGFVCIRVFMAWLFRICVAQGRVSQSVVVIGTSVLTAAFIKQVEGNPYGINIAAIFSDASSDDEADESLNTNGNLHDLIRYQRTHEIDTVVIALPQTEPARLRQMIRDLSLQSSKIRILPGELALDPSHKWYSPLGEIPGVQLMAVSDRPISLLGYVAKNIFDRLVALLALTVLAPVMLICMAAIKLSSPGPLFYRQKRIGYHNRVFDVYKFRSMHTAMCDMGTLTQRNDPRVFAFGQIMRRLSFDELPQLINVLKGDMSLVGPRPHMPEARAAGRFYFDVVNEYAYRHRVKPGITGWAQVNGWRGPTETVEQIQQRVSHDLYYIDNWAFSLDLLILFKTGLMLFADKNNTF